MDNPKPESGRLNAIAPRFERVDWLALLCTTALALAVYLFTLAPDVTLGFSGIFAVGAFYGGVPHPPGYPLFTIYAWTVTHLLPFSNVAWRVAVASAIAAALSCGMIALLVSPIAGAILRADATAGALHRRALVVRVLSGCSAGLVFGFSGAFWNRAVIADPWPFSICLFCLGLCFLLRWIMSPAEKRFLFAAAFTYGLTLTNSQMLLSAAPALVVMLIPGDRRLARDVFVLGSLLLGSLAYKFVTAGLSSYYWFAADGLWPLILISGVLAAVAAGVLIWRTRAIFTEWPSLIGCCAAFLIGLSPYLYVPISSMTNPPMNWGYARTQGGFLHTLTRGQYERIAPTRSFQRFGSQVKGYAQTVVHDLGGPPAVTALFGLLFLRRVPRPERGWIASTVVGYVCFTLLMVAVLNPDADRESQKAVRVFYSASYVFVALWFGCALSSFGAHALKKTPAATPSS